MRFNIVIFFILITMSVSAVFGASPSPSAKPKSIAVYSMNNAFFSALASDSLIERDNRILSRVNAIVDGIATVTKIEQRVQYKKKICIVAVLTQSKITIIYNIYAENIEFGEILQPGQKMSFKGQIASVAHVNTRRDTYVVDIILEDGAAVVE
jgi:hypothetical protein